MCNSTDGVGNTEVVVVVGLSESNESNTGRRMALPFKRCRGCNSKDYRHAWFLFELTVAKVG